MVLYRYLFCINSLVLTSLYKYEEIQYLQIVIVISKSYFDYFYDYSTKPLRVIKYMIAIY